MRRRTAWLLALVAAGFVWGVLQLFGVEFASGAVYPPYSSLRAEPDGARLLYDSLARLPGLAVSRNYLPLELLQGSDATVLLLGLDARNFGKDMDLLRTVRRLAERGNRVVLAAGPPAGTGAIPADKLNREWGVHFGVDPKSPASHRLYFSRAEEWTVTDRVGERPIAIERGFGKGMVVMLAESLDFDNQSSVARDRIDDVAAALGVNRRIVFDEQHFGLSESGTIVGLARRYRLGGMALGLLVCAVLWIWRSTSSFPPPAMAVAVERLEGRTSHAGLLTLLRRHIRPGDLPAVSWQEWVSTNRVRPDAAARAAGIIGSVGAPVEKMRMVWGELRSPGTGQEARPHLRLL
jgi:hypothetical protein